MPNLACPQCGAQFDLAAVAQYERFACSQCRTVIQVPRRRAAPAAPRAPQRATAPRRAQPAATPAQPAQALPDRGSRRRGRPRDRTRDASQKEFPVAAVAGGVLALVILGIGAVFVFGSKKGEDAADAADVAATDGGAAASPTGGNPDKDPAAWRRLPPEERLARVADLIRGVNVSNEGAVEYTVRFLEARGEEEGAKDLALRFLDKRPDSGWARRVVGHVDLRKRVEKCLDKNEKAYEVDAEPVLALTRLMEKRQPGAWWADGATQERVDGLIREIEEAEKRLGDPYEQGVARWIQYQRKIDVMRDMPSIAKAVGPYVVFAQVKADPGTLIRDVEPDARRAAETVLEEHVELFAKYYDGFLEHFGEELGLIRYGPQNATFDTLLKANVFPDREMYDQFNVSRGMGAMPFVRAYYSPREPRFICTYVGTKDEDKLESAQVQCHELTHQIVHFYTWDLARQNADHAFNWLDVSVRPAWSEEGFAEFFSALKPQGEGYEWMQLLHSRMQEVYVLEELLRIKGWATLSLEEMLRPRNTFEVTQIGLTRAREPNDQALAGPVFASLFYGRAWALVHFMWFHEEGGRPKWRAKFLDYLKFEFNVQWDKKPVPGRPDKFRLEAHPVIASDFRRVMGLEDKNDFLAFAKSYETYLESLLSQHKTAAWDAMLERMRKGMGGSK